MKLAPVFSWRGAIAKSTLTSTQKLVAWGLSLYMNEAGGSAFPSQAALAHACSLGRSTVRQALAQLVKKGWLVVEYEGKGDGKPNHYRATIPATDDGGVARSQLPGSQERATELAIELSSTSYYAEVTSNGKGATKKKELNQTHGLIFAALCEMMGRPPSGGEGAAWGGVAKRMVQEGVPPSEIAARARRMAATWPSIPPSPMTLWKHWGEFAGGGPTGVARAPNPTLERYAWEDALHEEAEKIRRRDEREAADQGHDGDSDGGGSREHPGLPSQAQRPEDDEHGRVEGDGGDAQGEP